mmetsp:Transcript_30643/g.92712  ORF Transcript_30643/g.92712 Transcript_30643/m.92712 type:complete len:418 (+) Transcript_30643:661-1914(+)
MEIAMRAADVALLTAFMASSPAWTEPFVSSDCSTPIKNGAKISSNFFVASATVRIFSWMSLTNVELASRSWQARCVVRISLSRRSDTRARRSTFSSSCFITPVAGFIFASKNLMATCNLSAATLIAVSACFIIALLGTTPLACNGSTASNARSMSSSAGANFSLTSCTNRLAIARCWKSCLTVRSGVNFTFASRSFTRHAFNSVLALSRTASEENDLTVTIFLPMMASASLIFICACAANSCVWSTALLASARSSPAASMHSFEITVFSTMSSAALVLSVASASISFRAAASLASISNAFCFCRTRGRAILIFCNSWLTDVNADLNLSSMLLTSGKAGPAVVCATSNGFCTLEIDAGSGPNSFSAESRASMEAPSPVAARACCTTLVTSATTVLASARPFFTDSLAAACAAWMLARW